MWKRLKYFKFIRRTETFFVQLFFWFISCIPTFFGILVRKIIYRSLFAMSGKNLYIDLWVTFYEPKRIKVGNNITIMKNCCLCANEGGELTIGDNFGVNTNSLIGASGGSIIIGNDVLIGPNCVLRAADHNFERIDIPINKQGHKRGVIIIDDDVWIGSNCVITSNVHIHSGAVVAAGAVVTKNVPSFAVVGGVPARVLRYRHQRGQ